MPIGFGRSVFGKLAVAPAGPSLRNHTVTARGNTIGWPRLLRQSGSTVLAAPTTLSTSVAKFDGTGDAIHVEPENAGDFVFTGQFTFEFFFLYEQTVGSGASATLISNRLDTSGIAATDFFILWRNFDDKLQIYTPDLQVAAATGTLAEDTWHHVALCRDASGNQSLFVNGTREQTVASSTNPIGLSGSREAFGLGGFVNGSGTVSLPFNQGTNGYMDMIRVSDTDRYGASNSSITVPTTGFTNDSNTKFLVDCNVSEQANNFQDEKFEDRRSVGCYIGSFHSTISNLDALSNTQSKFGTTSLQLTGSTNESFAAFGYQNPGTGAFTQEFFFYPTTLSGNQPIFGAMNDSQTAQLWFLQSGTLALYMNNANNTSWGVVSGNGFGTANVNQWNHVALCRTGDNLELFMNGARGNSDTPISLSAGLDLGAGNYQNNTFQSPSPATGVEGYRQNVFTSGKVQGSTTNSTGFFGPYRVSSSARYTGSSYTVPTSNFTNDADTLFIVTMDGTNGDRDIIDANT